MAFYLCHDFSMSSFKSLDGDDENVTDIEADNGKSDK